MAENTLHNDAGFSLVELMIALTIFAVGLLGIAGMQITSLQSNAGAYKRTTINNLAAGIMEEIHIWGPEDPKVIDEAGNPHQWDFDPTGTLQTTLDIPGGGSFTASYVVEKDVPNTNLSTITLTVESTGTATGWGGDRSVITCIKKYQ